jgi:hypothetical protein
MLRRNEPERVLRPLDFLLARQLGQFPKKSQDLVRDALRVHAEASS